MGTKVEIIRKASHACFRCRARKQGCDRALPSCSRCALKLRCCDYSLLPRRPVLFPSPTVNPLRERKTYAAAGPGGLDLTAWGQNELMQSVWDDLDDERASDGPSGSEAAFAQKVSMVLSDYQISEQSLVNDYASSIHDWLPILNAHQFQKDLLDRRNTTSPFVHLNCLLLLLVTRVPAHRQQDAKPTSRLYVTARAVAASLQTRASPSLAMLQTAALLALYECGQGMTHQAHLTLSGAVAVASLVDHLDAEKQETLYCKVTLLTLDIMIALSATTETLPLLCPPTSPLVMSVRQQSIAPFEFKFSGLEQDRLAERFHATAEALLLAGRVLHHVYCSRVGLTVDDSEYQGLTAETHHLADFLMRHWQGHTWPFCGPIVITLNCMISLHQERVRRTKAQPGSRDDASLQTAHRLAWDTCRIPMETIQDVGVVPKLSLVCMCCAFRAAAIVIASAAQLPPPGEIATVISALDQFRQRWRVGDKYLRGITKVIGRQ